MSKPVLLILGAGANIGTSVARKFAQNGYRVALASRRPLDVGVENSIHVPLDLTKTETIGSVFDTVKEKFGESPSVVVYNAALYQPDSTPDPLASFNFSGFAASHAVNTTSVIAALQHAVAGFKSLPATASKTFIFTGNSLNVSTIPGFLTFGLTKAGAAYTFRYLVEQAHYTGDGITFYYADERKASGAPSGREVSGAAAADEYLALAQRKDQGPWLYTFVHGQGYKEFGDNVTLTEEQRRMANNQ